MLINYINKIAKVIVFCSLTLLTFTFLHSEVGLLDFDDNNHSTHDYCEIVKNTNSHSKQLKEELPKLEINKDIDLNLDCLAAIEAQITITCIDKAYQHQILKQSTDTYLFNRTFLI